MTEDTDDELRELREQTDVGTRIQDTPDTADGDALEDAIVTMLHAVDDGDVSKTLSLRDGQLAALIRGLEETGELDDVGVALRDQLGRESDDDIDRSEVLRLAVRVGLQEATSDVIDTAREAHARYASEQF